MKKNCFLFSILLILSQHASSQVKITENIYQLEEGKTPVVKASVEQLSWMEGSWRVEAWGGTCQELWSKPLGSAMMGMFQYARENETQIYEFINIAEEKGTLTLRIKHFTKNMKGWEHKDSSVSFPLVKLEGKAVYFSTQTYKLIDDKTMMVYFITGSPAKEEVFKFIRQ